MGLAGGADQPEFAVDQWRGDSSTGSRSKIDTTTIEQETLCK